MKPFFYILVLALVAFAPFTHLAQEQPPATPARPAGPTPVPGKKPFENVDAETFEKLAKASTNNVVLDVRTKAEYEKSHIPGSVHIDFNGRDFEQKIALLDKSKTYLVHCASGGRSAGACGKMSKTNFKSLYNLEGGLKAWEKAGKPVEKGK
jgi:phage shock protein E